MTTTEADALRPGDAVRIHYGPSSHGRVESRRNSMIFIRWRTGALVAYFTDSMQHIELDPEATQ